MMIRVKTGDLVFVPPSEIYFKNPDGGWTKTIGNAMITVPILVLGRDKKTLLGWINVLSWRGVGIVGDAILNEIKRKHVAGLP